ncbi:MAG: hypothetical protein BMS9Abin29_1941 [Gemmatimonadota bacterium]|nr:MAG: hypothetical protein BMS9Abin29_1941 [Gemmatimonadota bacterium]
MAQTDWILRLIEQLGAALIVLRSMILGGKVGREEVQGRLQKAVGSIGFDLDLAKAASPETVRMLVAPTGDVEPGRCWLVAEVLYLDGLQAQMEDRWEDARSSFERALPLYGLLEPHGLLVAGLPEAEERMAEIEGRLAGLPGSG